MYVTYVYKYTYIYIDTYTSIYKRSVPTTYWDRIVPTEDSKKIVDTCCSICEALRSCQYHARATSKFNTVSFVSPLVHCYKLGQISPEQSQLELSSVWGVEAAHGASNFCVDDCDGSRLAGNPQPFAMFGIQDISGPSFPGNMACEWNGTPRRTTTLLLDHPLAWFLERNMYNR
jgi:hypothetical protein